MNQIKLMQIAMNMHNGQAFPLTREDMVGCAEGMLTSKLFDSVRDSDIEEFTQKASDNWGVSFEHKPFDGGWIMHKHLVA